MLVERHYIDGTFEIVRLCTQSKLLYNHCLYSMRQAWFTNNPLPNISDLIKASKNQDCYKNLHNTKTAAQTIRQVLNDWSNFFKAFVVYNLEPEKFISQPQPPNYKKKLAQVTFFSETIRSKPLKQGIITPTNDLFSIKSDKKFKQVVVTPKTFGFIIEVQYQEEVKPKPTVKSDQVCCIDIGVNNLATITSDQHSPLLINGRILKSINQWFNKHPNKKNSKKRYFRIENYFHHASKLIIETCLQYEIGTIIIGKNIGWKFKIRMRKDNKQNFQYIPFEKLIQKIQYKALAVGISVILTEEAYTSKSSFLDRDPLPRYEKGVTHEFSGKRVGRGRYRSKDGRILNADVNGSANIGRKVIRDEDLILRLDRSLVARPVKINPLVCSTFV